MKVKGESEDAQSCPTLSDPIDCSLPGSSTHGIFQARVLEWVAIAFLTVLIVRGPFSNSCYQPQAIMFSSLLNRVRRLTKKYHQTKYRYAQ